MLIETADLFDEVHDSGEENETHVYFVHDAFLVVSRECGKERGLCFRIVAEMYCIVASDYITGFLARLSRDIVIDGNI